MNVDTTVQDKAIAFPTDARLYHKARGALVRMAQGMGIDLRQSYARLSRLALAKHGRYAHARQMQRARREQKRLKTYLGRVIRDIERKVAIAGKYKQNRNIPSLSGCWRLANAFIPNSVTTKVRCTACMHRKWNASPRARRTSLMNLASRWAWLAPARRVLLSA